MSHELLERLAAHIHALRFGDGLEGLARGVGLLLHEIDLAGAYPGAITSDGRLLVDVTLASRMRLAVVLWLLARRVIRNARGDLSDIPALARTLGAPRIEVAILKRKRWLLPDAGHHATPHKRRF